MHYKNVSGGYLNFAWIDGIIFGKLSLNECRLKSKVKHANST